MTTLAIFVVAMLVAVAGAGGWSGQSASLTRGERIYAAVSWTPVLWFYLGPELLRAMGVEGRQAESYAVGWSLLLSLGLAATGIGLMIRAVRSGRAVRGRLAAFIALATIPVFFLALLTFYWAVH
jgi:hypothetical protein